MPCPPQPYSQPPHQCFGHYPSIYSKIVAAVTLDCSRADGFSALLAGLESRSTRLAPRTPEERETTPGGCRPSVLLGRNRSCENHIGLWVNEADKANPHHLPALPLSYVVKPRMCRTTPDHIRHGRASRTKVTCCTYHVTYATLKSHRSISEWSRQTKRHHLPAPSLRHVVKPRICSMPPDRMRHGHASGASVTFFHVSRHVRYIMYQI